MSGRRQRGFTAMEGKVLGNMQRQAAFDCAQCYGIGVQVSSTSLLLQRRGVVAEFLKEYRMGFERSQRSAADALRHDEGRVADVSTNIDNVFALLAQPP